ncbi:MAG: hypothetical protein CMJ83_10375 [Planctomycetes bacterium]|nr:hypothetical protein [Planctomycetota bacterium]
MSSQRVTSETPPDPDWAYLDFMEVYLADLEAGEPRPLADYLARFPGHDASVVRGWLQLQSDSASAATAPAGIPAPALDRIGPYLLLEELGRGGQAVVWLAEDTRLTRRVALKVIPASALTGCAQATLRLQREAAILSRLDHPGIGVVHETGTESGHVWIAMRYVDGESVADRISRRRLAEHGDELHVDLDSDATRPEPATGIPERGDVMADVALIEDAARALHAAHEIGIVHRDVKPGNVMVTADERPVLLDFGLARDDDDDESPVLTQTGDVFGTPGYMSPEQVRGERLDRRADVWSLAVTLYECLTLHRPFTAPTRKLLFDAIEYAPPDPVRSHNPAISPDLEIVILTALQKEPDRRYLTALDFADDLRAVREMRPIRARPPSVLSTFTRWVRREPVRAALVLSVVIALAGVAALSGYLIARMDDLEEAETAQRLRRIDAALGDGYFALDLGDLDGAVVALRSVFSDAPDHPLAWQGLALVTLNRDGPDAADAFMTEHPPANHPAIRGLAAANRAGTTLPLPSPDTPLPRTGGDAFLQGLVVLQTASQVESRTTTPDTPRLTYARDRIRVAIAISRRAPRAFHYLRTQISGKIKDTDDAERAMLALQHLFGDRPRDWWVIGRTRGFLGQDAGALEAFDRALDLDPTFTRAWFQRGEVHYHAQRWAEALRDYERAAHADPDSQLGWWGIAAVHRRLAAAATDKTARRDHLVETRVACKKAADAAPRSPRTLADLARAHIDLDEVDDAERVLRLAINVDPRSPQTYLTLALLKQEHGSPAEAVPPLEQCYALNPIEGVRQQIVAILTGVARTHRADGHIDELIATLEKALKYAKGAERAGLERALSRARQH